MIRGCGEPPTRPAPRWHGGKWRLAPWIIDHLPPHRVYAEPFGGAASVLLRKPRAYAEIYNDLDGDVVTLFRVLRSAEADKLIAAIAATPYARAEFEEAYLPATEDVEIARRLVVRSFLGFGSNAHNLKIKTGFRHNVTRQGTHPAMDWTGMPEGLRRVAERFRGVVVEQRDALRLIHQHDGPDTLFYVDPPYVHSTRTLRFGRGDYHGYNHEMSDDDHAELLARLCCVEGMVVLSGYAHPLYDAALAAWHRVERDTHADGARPRREVLWINPAADRALGGRLQLEGAHA